MEDYKLSEEQIRHMKHAIGYSSQKVTDRTVKRYEAYRNHYSAHAPKEELDELVVMGYMDRRPHQIKMVPNAVIYSVTSLGLKYLTAVLDVKITISR